MHTQPEFRQQVESTTLTELKLSPTKPHTEEGSGLERNKEGRPRKTPNVIPWTVRGVDLETRTTIEKAASRSSKRASKSVGQVAQAAI